ncbi:Transmembrane protein 70, mitochondrial [Amphibalanus amphitrite]|uniref:Transmembrane protein 70, mitochondrial n=1 Tax=Amphibalanus amphitrite TaxID=1232801 RepID=A0A6A4X598_AMPAM|nr:Transmembrane protein 70, mitochondrial [Amphibalanus amphitrite]
MQSIETSKIKGGAKLEKSIESRMNNMEEKLCNEILVKQKEISDKQKQIETTINKQANSAKDLKMLMESKYEKEKRENNLILHNVPESQAETPDERVKHDKEMFMKVVSALVGTQENVQVDKIYRLGKKQAQPEELHERRELKGRLMLIRVKEKEHVDILIKRRTQLRDKGFPNIYITRDLTPEERESQRKQRAELEAELQVVYRGPLTGQMKRLKVFSLFTSAVGMYVAPTVMAEMGKAGMGIAIMMGSVMGIFTLMTPVLIHLVVRNYVTQLTYDPSSDHYTANTITLMLRTRQVEFSPADVHVPDVPGMFTTFVAKGKPLFADANHFQPIEHFGRIMGYDRPVDLKLGKRPSPDQEQPPA